MTHTMMSGLKIVFVLLFIGLFACYTSDKQEFPVGKQSLLVGKWQSLNDRNLSFEFNNSNEKRLIRINFQSQPGLMSDTLILMDSKYRIVPSKRDRLKIIEDAGYGDDASATSEIEFINKDRMIMYIYKHHGILDVADEFARTSSPHKFDSIMNAIMLSPD